MTESLGIWAIRWLECRLTRVPFAHVKKCYETTARSGTPIEWKDLVSQFLAGGDLNELVDGLHYAKANGANLTVQQACGYQLYARAKYRISLRDWLMPFIQSGVHDLGAISLGDFSDRQANRER